MLRKPEISNSLGDLRKLSESFRAVPRKMATRRQLLRATMALGRTAVPLLLRQLVTGDEARAAWAYYLLSEAAGPRAVGALRDTMADARVPEARRALVLALLGELGAPLPASVRLLEDREPGRGELPELARGLREPADAAHAADELLARAEGRDLVAMARELCTRAGVLAAPILDELCARDDVATTRKHALAGLRAGLGEAPPLVARPIRVWIGTGAGGAVILGARRGRPGRVLVVHLDPDGALARVVYQGPPGDGEGEGGGEARLWRERLLAEGYVLRAASVAAVSARVAAAARAVCHAGARLPRAYHLGRDLVGLFDEHLAAPAPAAADALFERGRALLDAGDPERARGTLSAYVSVRPEDAEGRTWLGSCLLALAEVAPALAQLAAAARLEPEDPVRHWNLAAAAKGCGRSGAAYLALRDYLRLGAGRPATRRRRVALRFVRTYERVIANEHPANPAAVVARAEAAFLCGCAQLDAGQTADAIRCFRAVVERVPSHHPSWSNLGAAHLALGQRAEARRCLEIALSYRPDYELARANLERVTSA
jgi:tetratricopeptide (TPR) repeat protein